MALSGFKLVMQLFLRHIIEADSINCVHKCIHKKDAAVFHHIITEETFRLGDYTEMK